MNDIPARASAVIMGAGIVGNSLACHLARLGWRDLVLVDKGPMPNPGGSTGHASNFIFPIEYSKMMMELTRDSTEQYQELGVFTQSRRHRGRPDPGPDGRTAPALHRGQGLGHPGPDGLARRGRRSWCPTWIESVILGGAHFPTVGVVDSLRAGTLMREEAQRSGALQRAGRRRGARHRHHGARPAGGRDHRGAHHRGRDRDQHLRDLLRRVEPAHRRGWPGPGSRSPRSCTR